MGLPEPKSCWCFDTKTGSLILGALYLKYSLLVILLTLSGRFYSLLYEGTETYVKYGYMEKTTQTSLVMSICIAAFVFFTIHGICMCLFIHGIRKDLPRLMFPALVSNGFALIWPIILTIYVIAVTLWFDETVSPTPEHESTLETLVAEIIFLIIVIALKIYYQLVMNAYYKQLKRSLPEDRNFLVEELSSDEIIKKVKV